MDMVQGPDYHGLTAFVQPKPAMPRGLEAWRLVSINVDSAEVLTSCLAVVPSMGPISRLVLHVEALTPAQVQLLAGLEQVTELWLRCSSGFCLDALPATSSTDVQFQPAEVFERQMVLLESGAFGRGEVLQDLLTSSSLADLPPLTISWQAMVASRASEFTFQGPVIVTGYIAQPFPAVHVKVCHEPGTDVLVTGLPWEDMRAACDGWQAVAHCSPTVGHPKAFARGHEP